MKFPFRLCRPPASVVLMCALIAQSHAQQIDSRAIYLLANSIADDVEQIREVMGRPYDDSPRLPASEVSAVELFLQAQTLIRKVNQLAQEAGVAERATVPPAPEGAIEREHIYNIVEQAGNRVTLVKESLGIEGRLEPLRRESSISDTGIFMTIIDINRQLNLLLDETIGPSDVYGQVALVNSYAAGIIERLAPGTEQLSLPSDSTHRRPADVYAKLLECLDSVSRIARNVEGARVMSLSSRRNVPDDIEPGHVYDIAVILVADVATLAIELGAEGRSLDFPEPDRIFPTQVYQRAALLEEQLALIDTLL